MSTTASLLPLFERVVRLYMRLVRLARGYADDLRFQLQTRKLLVHSADQVQRAARTVFGRTLTEKVQHQIDAAMELAENVSKGMVGEFTSDEARRIAAALAFKLSFACVPSPIRAMHARLHARLAAASSSHARNGRR